MDGDEINRGPEDERFLGTDRSIDEIAPRSDE
jgi:hypothetical protein